MSNYKTTVSFWIKREKFYTVEVKSFFDGVRWHWNVYAHIFDNCPFYENNSIIFSLPFHGGITFDKIKTIESIEKKYDFQKGVNKVKVVGSDYAHDGDDYDNHPSPIDGIYYVCESDAIELVAAIELNLKDTKK